jgi:hypothetical protein
VAESSDSWSNLAASKEGLTLVSHLSRDLAPAPAPTLPTAPGSRDIGRLYEPHRSADIDDPESGECMGVVYVEDDQVAIFILQYFRTISVV